MKKIVWLLVLCIVAWLAKLSYDVYQMAQQSAESKQQLQQLEKNNKQLNDQILALNRQVQQPTPTSSVTAPMLAVPNITVMTLIGQKLELIEFALAQQQHLTALQHLQALDAQIDAFELAPALKESLHQVIAKDIAMLQQYAVQVTSQQQQVNEILQKVDQQLSQALSQPSLAVAVNEHAYFWQRWFKLEKAEQAASVLQQRSLILKEVQLRLLVLKNLSASLQPLQQQSEYTQIAALLKQLPDQQSQQILQQLNKLTSIQTLTFPQLHTRTLVN